MKTGKQIYKKILQQNLSRLSGDDIEALHKSLERIITILNKLK